MWFANLECSFDFGWSGDGEATEEETLENIHDAIREYLAAVGDLLEG